jgi:hypothetical protein
MNAWTTNTDVGTPIGEDPFKSYSYPSRLIQTYDHVQVQHNTDSVRLFFQSSKHPTLLSNCHSSVHSPDSMSYSAAVTNLVSAELRKPGPVISKELILLLGLSPINLVPHGEPKFSTNRSGVLDEFYQSTKSKVNEISRDPNYTTKDQLEMDALRPSAQFLHRITGSILSDFGSRIWHASNTHTTAECPTPLIYNVDNDQEK